VDEVKIVPVVQTVPVLGRMVPRQSGVVAARISGPVARMNVHVGDRVKKGDVLAILVQDTLRWQRELKAAEVVEYEGVVASSRARLAKTQNELRRIQRLSRSAAFSQARFEDQQHVVATSQGELKKAEAELRQARANYNMAAINLKYSEVRAPYPGVVIQRHTDAGAYLGVGGPVVTLLNDAELEIEVDAPSSRLGGLTAGAVIAVEFEDKKSRQATVRAVIPDENPLARTRAVRLTPSDAMRRVNAAANQSVLVRIPVGAKRNALSVHKDAKLQRSGNSVVFVVKGGRAELRRVRLGTAIGGRFEVLGGLTAGEFVVVRGNERLSDGKRVRLKGNGE
jgi:RND family efflux transporter MFP subunit